MNIWVNFAATSENNRNSYKDYYPKLKMLSSTAIVPSNIYPSLIEISLHHCSFQAELQEDSQVQEMFIPAVPEAGQRCNRDNLWACQPGKTFRPETFTGCWAGGDHNVHSLSPDLVPAQRGRQEN